MSAPAGLSSAGPSAPADVDTRDGRRRGVVWAIFALLGAVLVAYLAFLLLRSSQRFSPWFDGWLVVAFEALASLLCAAAGIAFPERRRVALVMGTACLAWTIGDLAITFESLGGATPPTPSIADAFYLAFFPLALVAILLLTRREVRRRGAHDWLDGAIAAVGMAALCVGVAFHGLEHLFGSPSLAVATNLAYPVGDLVLLGIVAGSTVVVTGRSRTILLLVAVGLAVNAAGDTFNFAGSTANYGIVINAIAWPTSILVIAMAMWQRERSRDRFGIERLAGPLLPGFVTVGSLAVLVAASWYRLGVIAVGLATLTLVLAGVRLAFRPALRLARERLRSTEVRYQLMFERNPLPMLVYERATLQIVDVSDAMVARYGYTRAELTRMSIRDLLPPEDRSRLDTYLPSVPDGSRPEYRLTAPDYPGRHRLRDGTIIDVDVTSNNVDLDGRACRIIHVDDVTARNRAAAELAVARDQAVEASNMKSAFLANVSHEIRTPMNGVIGMTELLLDMGLTDEQHDCAQQVARSGEQMLSIINDILDISKIETGRLELDIADFDLGVAIRETCAGAATLAKLKGVGLDVRIADAVPRRVRGDGRRLQQVVANLVSNAVKFTPAGAVTVTVSAAPAADGGSHLAVEVADTGIGIDPASLERVFEPFTQADASTTRLYGGTGLGLTIARELVELMGGSIEARSEPGIGSAFSFTVELAAPLESPLAPTAAPAGAAPLWEHQPLVLIAEDSQINQIVATRALERCGCRTHVAGDGHEALAALARGQYDAVLMDCQMPGMDGYQATAELRRRERGGPRTPVIAMTAHAMDGDRRRCLDAGMDDHISKPMRHAELAEVLARWISERPAAPAAPSDGPASARPRPGPEERGRPAALQPLERG